MTRRRMNTRLGSLSKTLEMRNEIEGQREEALNTNREKVQEIKAE